MSLIYTKHTENSNNSTKQANICDTNRSTRIMLMYVLLIMVTAGIALNSQAESEGGEREWRCRSLKFVRSKAEAP